MQNNQPSIHQHSNPNLSPNSIPQQTILYTQTFQCYCSQTFKTIDQYQAHVSLGHHDNYFPVHPINQSQKPSNLNSRIQQMKQQNVSQNLVHQELQQNEHQNRLRENHIQISTGSLKQYIHPLNFHNYNNPTLNNPNLNQQFQLFSKANITQNTSFQEQQKKQIDFAYVKTYYQHKMSPFYRQFDIEPIQNQNPYQSKSSQTQRYKKIYRQSPINPEISMANIVQNASKDQRKVHLQFDARILPIENAFIEFIQNFIRQNSKLISQITPQKREAIPKIFFQRISTVQKLVLNVHLKEKNQTSNKNEEEEMMENDLFECINQFIRFLTDKLRFYQIWIVQTISIIIFDTIAEYYSKHHEEMYENLKVSDFPYLYQNIILNTQSKKYDLAFEITTLTMTQFVIHFNQWCSVFQYINNKKRIDYIQPLINQINQMNEVYRDNVKIFRKCIKIRKMTYAKRLKRKIIENRRSEVKRQNESHNIKDLKQMFQKYGINPKIRRKCDGEEYELIPNKIPKKVTDTSKYLPFSHLKHNKQAGSFLQGQYFESKNILNNGQQQLRQFEQRLVRNYPHESKVCGIEQLKQRSNDPLNDYESQGESSLQFVPKKSEYVNYFSQQKEEQRKKYEQDWNVSLKLFKQIMNDSKKFKPSMNDKVKEQLQKVYTLTNSIKLDSNFYYHLKKQIKATLNQYPGEQKEAVNRGMTGNQLNGSSNDPFLVIKDFRFKNQHEIKESEKGKSSMEQKGKSEFQIGSNYFIGQDQAEDQQGNFQKEQDPFDALV